MPTAALTELLRNGANCEEGKGKAGRNGSRLIQHGKGDTCTDHTLQVTQFSEDVVQLTCTKPQRAGHAEIKAPQDLPGGQRLGKSQANL